MKSLSAVRAKFVRLNVKADFTKLFEEVGESERNTIASKLILISNESIIICFFPSNNYWWVLTNLRIIISEKNEILCIQLGEIENVEVREIFNDEVNKQDCKSLDLNISNSESVKLILEPGTWHAMYNIFKFVVG